MDEKIPPGDVYRARGWNWVQAAALYWLIHFGWRWMPAVILKKACWRLFDLDPHGWSEKSDAEVDREVG